MRKINGKSTRAMELVILNEIKVEGSEKNDSQVHRLTMIPNKDKTGATGERYGRFQGRMLRREGWREHAGLPGCAGGCDAISIDVEEERVKVLSNLYDEYENGAWQVAVDDCNIDERAKEVTKTNTKNFRYAVRRMAVPR